MHAKCGKTPDYCNPNVEIVQDSLNIGKKSDSVIAGRYPVTPMPVLPINGHIEQYAVCGNGLQEEQMQSQYVLVTCGHGGSSVAISTGDAETAPHGVYTLKTAGGRQLTTISGHDLRCVTKPNYCLDTEESVPVFPKGGIAKRLKATDIERVLGTKIPAAEFCAPGFAAPDTYNKKSDNVECVAFSSKEGQWRLVSSKTSFECTAIRDYCSAQKDQHGNKLLAGSVGGRGQIECVAGFQSFSETTNKQVGGADYICGNDGSWESPVSGKIDVSTSGRPLPDLCAPIPNYCAALATQEYTVESGAIFAETEIRCSDGYVRTSDSRGIAVCRAPESPTSSTTSRQHGVWLGVDNACVPQKAFCPDLITELGAQSSPKASLPESRQTLAELSVTCDLGYGCPDCNFKRDFQLVCTVDHSRRSGVWRLKSDPSVIFSSTHPPCAKIANYCPASSLTQRQGSDIGSEMTFPSLEKQLGANFCPAGSDVAFEIPTDLLDASGPAALGLSRWDHLTPVTSKKTRVFREEMLLRKGFLKNEYTLSCVASSATEGKLQALIEPFTQTSVAASAFAICAPSDCGDFPGGVKLVKGAREVVRCPVGHVVRPEIISATTEGVSVSEGEGTTSVSVPEGVILTVSPSNDFVELSCVHNVYPKPTSWLQTGLSVKHYCEPVKCPAGDITHGHIKNMGTYGESASPVCETGYQLPVSESGEKAACTCSVGGSWRFSPDFAAQLKGPDFAAQLSQSITIQRTKSTASNSPSGGSTATQPRCACIRNRAYCKPPSSAASLHLVPSDFRPLPIAALGETRSFHCPDGQAFVRFPTLQFVNLICSNSDNGKKDEGIYTVVEHGTDGTDSPVPFDPSHFQCQPRKCPESISALHRAGFDIIDFNKPGCNEQLGGRCRFKCHDTDEVPEYFRCAMAKDSGGLQWIFDGKDGSNEEGNSERRERSPSYLDSNRCSLKITLVLQDAMTKAPVPISRIKEIRLDNANPKRSRSLALDGSVLNAGSGHKDIRDKNTNQAVFTWVKGDSGRLHVEPKTSAESAAAVSYKAASQEYSEVCHRDMP